MVNIQGAILWWEEWQLRILVLGSLGLQWFLLVAGPMRKYIIPDYLRRCIWLAYTGSDVLAIYALATIFNRHARESEHAGMAASLEVLWAPLLLVHLGGGDEVAVLNIQENEQWSRHGMTIVSQVTVALYAFYKSWPRAGDVRMLLSAIMLFISGIINFCEKPLALRRASIHRPVAMSSIIRGQRRKLSIWERCFTETDDSYKLFRWRKEQQKKPGSSIFLSAMDQVQVILSDISLLATVGKQTHVLARLSPGVEMTPWLRRAFEVIYTRANVVYAPAYVACDFLLVPVLYISAITLFAIGDKKGYNVTDVKMTYIFIVFTAVLDALGVLISRLLYRLMSISRTPSLCMRLPQYNLVDSVARRMRPRTGWLLKCATNLGYEDYSTITIRDGILPADVAEFVVFELLKHGDIAGLDLASYRNLTRRNWALSDDLRKYLRGSRTEIIRCSLCDLPFDESVLLWHIATDLCFRFMPQNNASSSRSILTHREQCTKVISNYMGYLFHFRPEMLMTGSRPHLFTLTMEVLLELFQEKNTTPLDRRALSEFMADVRRDDYPLIRDAFKLAEELMAMGQDEQGQEKRSKLMFGVWTGMLCYSASMCRGYLHAKSLGEGGEFLTYIWIVISLKGARTLADKLQMSEEATTSGLQTEESSDQGISCRFHHTL